MLGLSGGEVAVICLVGLVAFGPKDVPKIARAAGKMTGRAVAFLFAARNKLHNVADRTELLQLQREVREAMTQLESIRYDALKGAQVFNDPTPFAARAFASDPTLPPQQSSTDPTPSPPPQNSSTDPGLSQGHSHHYATHVDGQYEEQAEAQSGSGSPPLRGLKGRLQLEVQAAVVSQQPTSQSNSPQDEGGASVLHHGRECLPLPHLGLRLGDWRTLAPSPAASADDASPDASGETPGESDVMHLPISAQSAGLLPPRKGAVTGSDLLVEVLLEERVALQAKRFLQEYHKGGDPSSSL